MRRALRQNDDTVAQIRAEMDHHLEAERRTRRFWDDGGNLLTKLTDDTLAHIALQAAGSMDLHNLAQVCRRFATPCIVVRGVVSDGERLVAIPQAVARRWLLEQPALARGWGGPPTGNYLLRVHRVQRLLLPKGFGRESQPGHAICVARGHPHTSTAWRFPMEF
eukprot:COSAG06_NODE_20850_length_779_cov_0.666176_1_plen_163_part_01